MASRIVFLAYEPPLHEALPLTMCFDSNCSNTLMRDIQGHSVGFEWHTNTTEAMIHIPPKDFRVHLSPEIDCYILTERSGGYAEPTDDFDDPACMLIDISTDNWSRIQTIFQPLQRWWTLHFPDICPYLIILVISVVVAILVPNLFQTPTLQKPIGVVRVGYFKKSVEFHHIQPHKDLSTKLSDDNILRLMVSDPDISSVRISLIANGMK